MSLEEVISQLTDMDERIQNLMERL